MSDIDFDELDRAVTSVLNGDTAKRQDEPLLEAHFETPEELAEKNVPAEAPKPVAVSAQALHPVAQRPVQRGRFLDMVHPAHDMAPRTAQPLGGANVAQSTNQTFVGDVTAISNKKPAEPPVQVKANSEPTPAPAAPAEPKSEVPEGAEPVDFFAGGPDKPAEPIPSPFIADAKVEKRPLGAFAGGSSEPAPLPVGDELHEKLVEVESEDNVIETAESPIPVTTEPTPVISKVEAPVVSADPKTDTSLFGAGHLAKNRPDKPAKHGKGTLVWLTVLIAVLLIGLGVGASLYFFVLNK